MCSKTLKSLAHGSASKTLKLARKTLSRASKTPSPTSKTPSPASKTLNLASKTATDPVRWTNFKGQGLCSTSRWYGAWIHYVHDF